MMGIPLRAVIAALIGGSFAIILNQLALVMIGKINEKLEPDRRISYFHWGSGIKQQFRQLYPDSKLIVVVRVDELGLVLSFVGLLWALGIL
jgi:hypothetical protein